MRERAAGRVISEEFTIGVDLGQRQDFTAIAVVERARVLTGRVDYVTYEREEAVRFRLRWLERLRLGTPYTDAVARVQQVGRQVAAEGITTVAVDGTGVGAAVVDMLRYDGGRYHVMPVVITGGDVERQQNGYWYVPKTDLIGRLQVMLEKRQLAVAAGLQEGARLQRELGDVRVRTTKSGRRTYEARGAGRHDDLVLAVALACWAAADKGGQEINGKQPLF